MSGLLLIKALESVLNSATFRLRHFANEVMSDYAA